MDNLPEWDGDWNEKKDKLKQKFDMLTETDLVFATGKQDELLARLQTKLGRTKKEVHQIISEL